MPIYASAGEGTTFTPAPAGVHQAVCVDVIDKGIIETSWQGKPKKSHKIDIAWQINEHRDDGKPYMVFKRYTLSIGEKANLRKDLESWRGRPFSREEELQFDVETVIGANCLVNVQHNQKGDKTYANVVSIMPLAKGMAKIAGRDYQRVCDRPAGTPQDAPPVHDEDEFAGHHEPATSDITAEDVPF